MLWVGVLLPAALLASFPAREGTAREVLFGGRFGSARAGLPPWICLVYTPCAGGGLGIRPGSAQIWTHMRRLRRRVSTRGCGASCRGTGGASDGVLGRR